MECEAGVRGCKLLHTEWINKVLLYSTGNDVQYTMIKNIGKEYLKKNIYITESFAVEQKYNIVKINYPSMGKRKKTKLSTKIICTKQNKNLSISYFHINLAISWLLKLVFEIVN